MDSIAQDRLHYALVVDDDAIIRMDAAGILEDAGFQTLEACDVAAALNILEHDHAKIDLLFTDVQMPGGRNGFELARLTAEHWSHISIVVASGHVSPSLNDLPEGAHFVSKPFSAQVVYHHLKQIIPDDQQPEPLKA